MTSATSNNQKNAALTIDTGARLVGRVVLEAPFRLYTATLHDFYGGAFSYVSPNCLLHRVYMGRYCSIGHQVEVLSLHPTNNLTTSPFGYQKLFAPPFDVEPWKKFEMLAETRIGHDVWIGAGVKIISGVKIGNGSIVGAGSVVTRDVPAFSVVAGAPAKMIRKRFSDDVIKRIESLEWWRFNILNNKVVYNDINTVLSVLEEGVRENIYKDYEAEVFKVWRNGGRVMAERIGG